MCRLTKYRRLLENVYKSTCILLFTCYNSFVMLLNCNNCNFLLLVSKGAVIMNQKRLNQDIEYKDVCLKENNKKRQKRIYAFLMN